MLTSIALIFLSGLALGSLFKKLKLPGLVGMIIAGMLLSPYALNLLDESVLNIAAGLRQAALVIILTRAGLALNLNDLKKSGIPAILMCFVPACFEIAGTVILAPKFLGLSVIEAAIMGSVIAAVSPAVIVPRMIKLIEAGYGKEHSVPQLILAGASVDDIFVIVVFTAFTGLASTGSINPADFLQVPISIILGILLGSISGLILNLAFQKINFEDTARLIVMLSISFLFIELENRLKGIVPLSGLIAIMVLGIVIKQKNPTLSLKLSANYNKLWSGAEIVLFVLVGAAVDLKYAAAAGIFAVIIVLGALVFRMAGVFTCVAKSRLLPKERLFCMIAYTPKATVQAAIGAVPLSMGLACGNDVLTVAVLSILITAPLGAFFIDRTFDKLLIKD